MAHSLSTRDRMFDWLAAAIDAGDSLPTDAAIADRFGFASPERARTLLAELADEGRITILDWSTRAIALGRVRRGAPVAARPTPTIARRDEALESGVAKLLAIAGRTRRDPHHPSPAPVAPPEPVAPADAPVSPEPGEEDVGMSLPATRRTISVPVEGDLLAGIERYGEEHDLALGRAALELAEKGLAAIAAPAVPTGEEGPVTVLQLSGVPVEWLVEEITRRLAGAASAAERDAALARAEAAEGQLATIRVQVAQLVGIGA